jgi:hypothetical protein
MLIKRRKTQHGMSEIVNTKPTRKITFAYTPSQSMLARPGVGFASFQATVSTVYVSAQGTEVKVKDAVVAGLQNSQERTDSGYTSTSGSLGERSSNPMFCSSICGR